MDVRDAPRRYADALLFVTEVTRAATRSPGGFLYEEGLTDPLYTSLLDGQSKWEWSDNRQDVNLIAGGPLRAVVDFTARRHATTVPCTGPPPLELWPDCAERLRLLREALAFATGAATDAWRFVLHEVLAAWLSARLDDLLAPPPPGETLGQLEQRLREAVTVCHRYRLAVHGLFGDHHWSGREPQPWWCIADDLAAHATYATPVVPPAYVFRLDEGTAHDGLATLFVATTAIHPVLRHQVTITSGLPKLPGDAGPETVQAARGALAVLARHRAA
ncbi:hypothetical protein [Catellatospora paridis]|uniref:hypothetical protein n=1 Tax=Catellatospora paridis TaxID=1617086 RepID=UPI0012D3A4FC|nr:hypothetical protein [Catellatospora paridis]